MKSIEKKGIEKLENNQIKLVSELIGGTESGIFSTSTTKYGTTSHWYDKDSHTECNCPNE